MEMKSWRENAEKIQKSLLIKPLVFILLGGLSFFLLGRESIAFLTWWLLAGVLGMVFMPVTGMLFSGFDDKGWMFSKMVGISITGFAAWFLVSAKILKFTTFSCIFVTVLCSAGCAVLLYMQSKKGLSCFAWEETELIFWQEVLFFLVFLMWVYIAGFRPETSNSTEKFMDYGFMEAMMRSTTLPPKDIWYSEGTINYYYGGQYFAVFLSRLTGTKPAITYNISRMLVAAMAFSLPCSLTYQLFMDRQRAKGGKSRKQFGALAGILAGIGVGIAGNMHHMVYGVILPLIQKWKGEEVTGYWFPDATRYIGHNPDVPTDKTIHEFPCYSFVLGDLHAHVVNLMFVLLLIGLLYAWMQKMQKEKEEFAARGTKEAVLLALKEPHILMASWLLGIYHWTNFWDFVIYFVVTGGVMLFTNIVLLQGKWSRIFLVTACQAAEVIVISTAVILPFTMQFETMVSGVALAQNHSRLHQLAVLWGLPAVMVILFIASLLWKQGKKNVCVWMAELEGPDLFILILGLCALGLVFIPEVVYVRDIYEATSARANTMFKLTYQAFVMFGICMGYILVKTLVLYERSWTRAVGTAGLVCFLSTTGYFGRAVDSWYGNILDKSGYKGLNTTAFLETEHTEDAAAIRWLSRNVEGQPVVLEANGDSYTGYCRVSAMTGLPTILGWYVHEWLWRSDVEDVNQKSADVESIFTSDNDSLVRSLLTQYEVSYIFLGAKEREKYGDRLNTDYLKSLGEVVFQDISSQTCIVKLPQAAGYGQ